MNIEWQDFLLNHGGQANGQRQVNFAAPQQEITAAQTQAVLANLDHLGVIQVSGADAQTFLQAQFSNDIAQLDSAHAQLNAYCNPKGRMFAQFIVVPHNDTYFLLLPHEILNKVLMRLRMFVLRSQVVLEDMSETYLCLGIINHHMTNTLSKLGDLPTTPYALTEQNEQLLVNIPSPFPRYLVITRIEQAKALWQIDDITKTGANIWQWCDIQAGIPTIWQETLEEFVPQMVNLELIGGVNFKKGCYPGQEIVARMHYLGKPKRRMFRLHTTDIEVPSPGTQLYLPDGNGQSIGKVVSAQQNPEQGVDLLAVIQLSHIDAPQIHLNEATGPQLDMQELPYSLDS